MLDSSDYDCSICQSLLLDPVVGPCGHDFCAACILAWSAQSSKSALGCPLCRAPLPRELGVCVRLRETLEVLFPQKVAERRKELQERKSMVAAVSTGAHPAQRSLAAAAVRPSFGHPSRGPSRAAPHAADRGQAMLLASALPATASMSAGAVAPLAPAAAIPLGTWVPPVSLGFSLGWFDPSEGRRRRSLTARRRRMMAV
ncbi:Bifunctional apoptosis regulator [Tetrabaena socialis]|uniref:Bifunctional apoptosis regulator n=1 Tax=Tetrabaena socialis TaxID=47790 RepID=A0A2J8AGR5_9CHLO|nr:Bifunctional apoptosis regulator [Tetrabaena socialis]|eukprot:PNH11697.1 Bifunctional apoptosis regulator [Tetrabaena socialis]